jgi:hypothetical protein
VSLENSTPTKSEIAFNFAAKKSGDKEKLNIAEILKPLVPLFRTMMIPRGISIF